MCSEIHNRRLELWIDRILVEATNPHCIIMVLGNNNYGVLPNKNERIISLRDKVTAKHRQAGCKDCEKDQCFKFVFAECNL